MRVLHVAMARNPSSGIVRQMLSEQKAALDMGLPWSVKIFVPDSIAAVDHFSSAERSLAASVIESDEKIKNTWIGFRKLFYAWLLDKEQAFDIILLRYSSYDPIQYFHLTRTKKIVLLVHHTLEVPELSLGSGIVGKFKANLEKVIGFFALRQAKGQIGVTREILDYEQKRCYLSSQAGLIYPNGIQIKKDAIAEDHRGDIPKLLFIASEFFPWHGLDRLLDSVQKSSDLFHLDLVGRLCERDRLRAEKDSRIRVHGYLGIDKIRELIAKADVGLSSFALDRNKMHEACTLKVREYLSMGLPVYAEHKDVFPEEFAFFKYGKCDVAAIIKYAMDMRLVSRTSIAEASRPLIDKRVLLKELYDQLQLVAY